MLEAHNTRGKNTENISVKWTEWNSSFIKCYRRGEWNMLLRTSGLGWQFWIVFILIMEYTDVNLRTVITFFHFLTDCPWEVWQWS